MYTNAHKDRFMHACFCERSFLSQILYLLRRSGCKSSVMKVTVKTSINKAFITKRYFRKLCSFKKNHLWRLEYLVAGRSFNKKLEKGDTDSRL